MTDPRFAGTAIPQPPLADDDGSVSADLAEALQHAASGEGDGAAVLRALALSRLLVPVVAVLEEAETGPDGLRRDKQSSMATVLVRSADGRRSLLAFSSTASLQAWQDDARPVPLAAPLAARAALDEAADALLVDVAGPVPFAVADGELLLLASAARPGGEPSADPVVRAAIRRSVGAMAGASALPPLLASAHLTPAAGPDGAVGLVLVARRPLPPAALDLLVQRLRDDPVLARLVPQGLHVSVGTTQSAPDTPDVLPHPRADFRHHVGHD